METIINEKIQEHEKLVHFMIHRMFNGNLNYAAKTRGFDPQDVIQEGKIGLWRAIESFDESKGAFSSYATRCIRNEILNNIVKKINMKGLPPELDTSTKLQMTRMKDIDDVKINKYERSYSFDNDVIHKVFYDEVSKHMSDRDKEIVRLRMDGYTIREIGKMMGCTHQAIEQSIRKRISHKLMKVKQAYEVV